MLDSGTQLAAVMWAATVARNARALRTETATSVSASCGLVAGVLFGCGGAHESPPSPLNGNLLPRDAS